MNTAQGITLHIMVCLISAGLSQGCTSNGDCENEGVCWYGACKCATGITGDSCETWDFFGDLLEMDFFYLRIPLGTGYTANDLVSKDAPLAYLQSVFPGGTVDVADRLIQGVMWLDYGIDFDPSIHYVTATAHLRELYQQSSSNEFEVGSGITIRFDEQSVYYDREDGAFIDYKTIWGTESADNLQSYCSDNQYVGDINGNQIPYCLDNIGLPHNCAVNGCTAPFTCDTSTGECECDGYNYDCSVMVPGEVDVFANCPTCDSAHTFACPSGGCTCNPGYYGDICDQNRVDAVCENDNFVLNIKPYENFGGQIFVLDTSINDAKITECTITDDDADGLYTKTFPYGQEDGACPAVNGITVDGVTTYTFKFYVQYDLTLYTNNDAVIEVMCKKLPDGSVETFTSNIGSINDILPDANSVASDIDSGIVAELRLTATGLAVSGAVDVGTSIQLCYTLTIGVTPDFSLKGVTSYNFEPTVSNLDSLPTDGTSSIIIEEWCIRKASSVFTLSLSKTSDENEVKITYEFTAYIYVTNPTDFDAIWFSSVLCLGACEKNGEQSAGCVPADHVTGSDNIHDTLKPASGGRKRKRREVGQTEEVLINQKLQVVERRDTQSEDTQKKIGDQLCVSVVTFILPIATLGSLLIISCCLVLYIWVKQRTSDKKC